VDRHPTATLTNSLIRLHLAILLLLGAISAEAQVVITKGTNFAVDIAADGHLAIDLLGKIWVIPPKGGAAEAVTDGALTARRARWSPDSRAIV